MATFQKLFTEESSYFGGALRNILDFMEYRDLFSYGFSFSCKFLMKLIVSFLEYRIEKPDDPQLLEMIYLEDFTPSEYIFLSLITGKTFSSIPVKNLLIFIVYSFKKRLVETFKTIVGRIKYDTTENFYFLEEILQVCCSFSREFNDEDYDIINFCMSRLDHKNVKELRNIDNEDSSKIYHLSNMYRKSYFYKSNEKKVKDWKGDVVETHILVPLLPSPTLLEDQYLMHPRRMESGNAGIMPFKCLRSATKKDDIRLFLTLMRNKSTHINFSGLSFILNEYLTRRMNECISEEFLTPFYTSTDYVNHFTKHSVGYLSEGVIDERFSFFFRQPKIMEKVIGFLPYFITHQRNRNMNATRILKYIPSMSFEIYRKSLFFEGAKKIAKKRFGDEFKRFQSRSVEQLSKFVKSLITQYSEVIKKEKIRFSNHGFYDGGTSREVLLFGDPKTTKKIFKMYEKIQKKISHKFHVVDKNMDYSRIEMIVLCFDCSSKTSIEYVFQNLFSHSYYIGKERNYLPVYLCLGVLSMKKEKKKKKQKRDEGFNFLDVSDCTELGKFFGNVKYTEIFISDGSDKKEDLNIIKAAFGSISSFLDVYLGSLI